MMWVNKIDFPEYYYVNIFRPASAIFIHFNSSGDFHIFVKNTTLKLSRFLTKIPRGLTAGKFPNPHLLTFPIAPKFPFFLDEIFDGEFDAIEYFPEATRDNRLYRYDRRRLSGVSVHWAFHINNIWGETVPTPASTIDSVGSINPSENHPFAWEDKSCAPWRIPWVFLS